MQSFWMADSGGAVFELATSNSAALLLAPANEHRKENTK